MSGAVGTHLSPTKLQSRSDMQFQRIDFVSFSGFSLENENILRGIAFFTICSCKSRGHLLYWYLLGSGAARYALYGG